MRKIAKRADAAKVVALCLPPVILSLLGLAALSLEKDRIAPTATRRTATPRPTSRTSG